MNEKNSHEEIPERMNELAEVFTNDKEAAANALIRSRLNEGQKMHWLLNMGYYNTVEKANKHSRQ